MALSAEDMRCSVSLFLCSNNRIQAMEAGPREEQSQGPGCQGPHGWRSTSALHCGPTQPHRTSPTYVGSPCHQGRGELERRGRKTERGM